MPHRSRRQPRKVDRRVPISLLSRHRAAERDFTRGASQRAHQKSPRCAGAWRFNRFNHPKGGPIMSNKTSFNPDEWTKVLQSVMMAGIAVSAAEPSGLWGTLKESMATGRTLFEAKSDAGSNELIKAVVADFETSEGRTIAREGLQAKLMGSKPSEIKSKAIDAVREASSLIDAKAPGDATAFKAWLRSTSQAVAE